MNRVKLASVADELSGKFNLLREKHALKSIVEQVVFEVLKATKGDPDEADDRYNAMVDDIMSGRVHEKDVPEDLRRFLPKTNKQKE
jgi:uncharacterized membrane protein